MPPPNDDEQQCDTSCRDEAHKCKVCGKNRKQLGLDSASVNAVEEVYKTEHKTARQKVYAFLNLPHHTREGRARSLGLVEDGDKGLKGVEPELAWVTRAKAKGCVNELLTGEKDAAKATT